MKHAEKVREESETFCFSRQPWRSVMLIRDHSLWVEANKAAYFEEMSPFCNANGASLPTTMAVFCLLSLDPLKLSILAITHLASHTQSPSFIFFFYSNMEYHVLFSKNLASGTLTLSRTCSSRSQMKWHVSLFFSYFNASKESRVHTEI